MPSSKNVDSLSVPSLPSKSSSNSLASLESQEVYFDNIQIELRKALQSEDILNHVVNLKDPERFLLAMRKMRESIVATSRRDEFTINAYKFMIRVSILLGHWASYRPALLSMHVKERQFRDLLILDCVRHDMNKAWSLGPTGLIRILLLSLVQQDWMLFSKAFSRCDRYQQVVLGHQLQQHAMTCLTKLYFTAKRSHVEKACGTSFAELKKINGDWELDHDDNVVLRRAKKKITTGS